MTAQVYDTRICALGEGPLWHPERAELFWFDILGHRLYAKDRHWDFDTFVSAAGWIDADTLLIASARSLLRFTISTGQSVEVCPLEAGNPLTRSNDGRADPWGGFWIGTMGLNGEKGAGTIWRYYKGTLRAVIEDLTITNAICFAPDRSFACYCDTPTQQIMRLPLDPETGWPNGLASVHIDLTGTPHMPDGAVMDADGCLWNAQWGSGRVACYGPDGRYLKSIELPAKQTTCPAFGGADLATLFCTSAAVGLDDNTDAAYPDNGRTFAIATTARGQPEHRVIL